MRLNRPMTAKPREGLSLKQLRDIEKGLGVYLDRGKWTSGTNQVLGVYDEAETYVGDVMSTGPLFLDEKELKDVILFLFRTSEEQSHKGSDCEGCCCDDHD